MVLFTGYYTYLIITNVNQLLYLIVYSVLCAVVITSFILELVFKQKAEKLAKNSTTEVEDKKRKMLILGLFIFVAVPFPITGVWTGTAIAVFLGMKFKDTFLPIVLGNLVAGSIITLLTFLLEAYVDYIILTLFVIAIIMLIIFIIKVATAKPEKTA